MTKRHFRLLFLFAVVVLIVLFCSACGKYDTTAYQEKADLLEEKVLSEQTMWELGIDPSGEAGYTIFLSVCSGKENATVLSASADTLEAAWNEVDSDAEKLVRREKIDPLWVKADVVYISVETTYDALCDALHDMTPGHAHYGVSFDPEFKNAFLEAELHANQVFIYGEDAKIDLSSFNSYLKKEGRKRVRSVPDDITLFQCFGWICDENNTIHMLSSSGTDYGRRTVSDLNEQYAGSMIQSAAQYMIQQTKEDGSFVYMLDPRNNEITAEYSRARHASAVWGLVQAYNICPSDDLKNTIDGSIQYLLESVVYNKDCAYLIEDGADELRLGSSSLAIVALTEYMELFDSTEYESLCVALGNGILSMMDYETGAYYHVLASDFSLKDSFRTIYYDGEATFALCRLYGLTGDSIWLDAASRAVDRFIREDYSVYRDHWVGYAVNEIIRYTENTDYYAFAIKNIQNNLDSFDSKAAEPEALELLMVFFETYSQISDRGISIEGFDHPRYMQAIRHRAERCLDGYYFPEYAMYMDQPERVVGSFMIREDGYRTRVDDIQHYISALYYYQKYYDTLVAYGLHTF